MAISETESSRNGRKKDMSSDSETSESESETDLTERSRNESGGGRRERSTRVLRKPSRLAPKRLTVELPQQPSPKKKRMSLPSPLPKITGDKDVYCWQCHRDGSITLTCQICPRTYHKRCAKIDSSPDTWTCIECTSKMLAESLHNRSEAMKSLTQDKLNQLLKFAMERIYSHEGADHFKYPVDLNEYPNYRDYIIYPMHLSLMEKNINNSMYQSTESFVADLKWLSHNSYIFNSGYSELTSYARGILKIAKQETEEIENCPNCYYHYHTMDEDNWFIEPCKKPHILVWAKLRGFPHWPAKVMRTVDEMVDVRFFGDHNRAWLPPESCYLFSKSPPFLSKTGNQQGYSDCIKEVFLHIKKLKDKYQQFCFSPPRIKYNPSLHSSMLSDMLPFFNKTDNVINHQMYEELQEKIDKRSVPVKSRNSEKNPYSELKNDFKKQDKVHYVKLGSSMKSDGSVVINSNKNMMKPKTSEKKEETAIIKLLLSKTPVTFVEPKVADKNQLSISKVIKIIQNGQDNLEKVITKEKLTIDNEEDNSKPTQSGQDTNTASGKMKPDKQLENDSCQTVNKHEESSSSENCTLKNLKCEEIMDSHTSSPCTPVMTKEPRIILSKITSIDLSVSDESPNFGKIQVPIPSPVSSIQEDNKLPTIESVVKVHKEVKKSASPEKNVSEVEDLTNDDAIEDIQRETGGEREVEECTIDNEQTESTLNEDLSQSPTEEVKGMSEAVPNQIRLKVRSSAELLSSEALMRHNSQENDNDSEPTKGDNTNKSSNEDENKNQGQITLSPLPKLEVIDLCDKEDDPMTHVSSTIEQVIKGIITVTLPSRELKNKPVKPASKVSQGPVYKTVMDDDYNCDDIDSGEDEDFDEEDERDDSGIPVNPDLDKLMQVDNITDISSWSVEPLVEDMSILDSMKEVFGCIENAQDLEECKNLMFKFKKLAILQRNEMKSFYNKIKDEAREVCNAFKYEKDRLTDREKDLARRIRKIKLTQWCSFCFKEANFYCCWGTSYCSKECQLRDWEKHYDYCRQSENNQKDSDGLRISNPTNCKVSLPPSVTINKITSAFPNQSKNAQPLTYTYTKAVCSSSLKPSVPGINAAKSSILLKQTLLPKSPVKSLSIPSKPTFVNNSFNKNLLKLAGSSVIEMKPLVNSKSTDGQRILIKKDRLRGTGNSGFKSGFYKVPVSSLVPSASKIFTAKNDKLYIMNRKNVPCMIQVPSGQLSSINNKLVVVKPSNSNVQHIAVPTGSCV